MRRIEILGALGMLLAPACSMESVVVGGPCATGYEPCGHTCCVAAPGATSSGAEGGTTTMPGSDAGNPNDRNDGGNDNDGGNTDAGTTDSGGDAMTCMQPEIL